MKPSESLFALGCCLFGAFLCVPARADMLSTSWVQGMLPYTQNVSNDGNPNFGLASTFNSPIMSLASQSGDGSGEAFSFGKYAPSVSTSLADLLYSPLGAFATATGPNDAFGNQAQSQIYLDDLLGPTTGIPAAYFSFTFDVDGSPTLTPGFSSNEVTFGFTVQSLGQAGSLDKHCHKDMSDLAAAFTYSCTETITNSAAFGGTDPNQGKIVLFEFLSAFASANWCPGGGCSASMDATHSAGLVSIEALDANGNPLGPVTMTGASGIAYGAQDAPEPSAGWLVLTAFVGWAVRGKSESATRSDRSQTPAP